LREPLGAAELHCPDERSTEALGARLARTRPPASPGALVVWLAGDLGAGKTTLARGFLAGCGIAGTVRSPTYTLVETYEAPPEHILHMDLYRLEDPQELDLLGVRDAAGSGNVWLVEWPERGAGFLPPADLLVSLFADLPAGETGRRVRLDGCTPAGRAWLAAI
jgi:tRNA threonylcarbamoyladenosine biosynthesis protein TsaE